MFSTWCLWQHCTLVGEDVVLRLRKLQICNSLGRREETTIAAYHVLDGTDQCCIGFLKHQLVAQIKAFDGIFEQLIEAFSVGSNSLIKQKKRRDNFGLLSCITYLRFPVCGNPLILPVGHLTWTLQMNLQKSVCLIARSTVFLIGDKVEWSQHTIKAKQNFDEKVKDKIGYSRPVWNQGRPVRVIWMEPLEPISSRSYVDKFTP